MRDLARHTWARAGWIAAALSLAAMASAGCATHERVDGILALAGDDTRGAALFAEHCAGCHGDDARGGQGGPDLVAHPHSQASTLTTILDGEGTMPAFDAKLSDQDAADLLCWVQNRQR